MSKQAAYPLQATDAGSYHFCADALRGINFIYISWLVFSFPLAVVAYSFGRQSPLSSVIPSVLVYYTIAGVHIFYRHRTSKAISVLSPEVMIMAVYTMFHLGYVTLYALGFVDYLDEIFVYEGAIPKALLIVNLGLIAFLFGFEIAGPRPSIQLVPGRVVIPTGNWETFGLGCMMIATTGHLAIIGVLGLGFLQEYGYAAIQDIERYTGSYALGFIWRRSLHLMILGVITYTFSSCLRYGKLFRSKFVLGMVALYMGMVILEGDRNPLMQIGAPILLVRHYFLKPIKLRYLFIMGVGLLVLFGGLAFVRTIVFDPARMLQEYQYYRAEGALTWMSPFLEMGTSFSVVNIVAHEVPSTERYWMGASWRDAAFHAVPFMQGIVGRFGWMTWSPTRWITETYYGQKAASRAFTVSAEGYLNFGLVGVFLELGFLGALLRRVTVWFSRRPSASWGVIMLGCTVGVLMVVRNHLGVSANVFIQVFILAWILDRWLGNEGASEAMGGSA